MSCLELLSIVLCPVSVFHNSACCYTELSRCLPTFFSWGWEQIWFPKHRILFWMWDDGQIQQPSSHNCLDSLVTSIVKLFLWNSTIIVKTTVLLFFNWLLLTFIWTVTSDFTLLFHKRIIYKRLNVFAVWALSLLKTEVLSVSKMFLITCWTVWCHYEGNPNVKENSFWVLFHFRAWLRKCRPWHHISCTLLDHYKIECLTDSIM